MIAKLLAEFVGTLVLVGVILASGGDALRVGVGLAGAALLVGGVSGGHLNPAVSTVVFAQGGIDALTFAGYVLAQFLGALGALGLRSLQE